MQKYLTLDCPLFYPKRPMNNSILLKVDTETGEFTFIDTTTKGETKEYPISIGGSGSGDGGGSGSGSSITYTAGDGITLSNHEFSITPDNGTDTNKFLVIGSNGIGLSGITEAILSTTSSFISINYSNPNYEEDGGIDFARGCYDETNGKGLIITYNPYTQSISDTSYTIGGENFYLDLYSANNNILEAPSMELGAYVNCIATEAGVVNYVKEFNSAYNETITGYINDIIQDLTLNAYGINVTTMDDDTIPKLQILLNENNETQKYLSLNTWDGMGRALTLSGIDEAIEAAISGKADKAEISEFVTATEVAEAIINKADKSEIENFITADAISGKADKSEITEFITAEDVELAVSGKADIEELISQNEYLEKKLKIFEEMLFNIKSKVGTKISSIENISGDINEDIVIELDTPINDVKSVSGLTITVTELNVESGRVVFTTPGDTIIQNLSTSGNLPQGVSNAQFSINTQGNVNISNCDDLNQTSYNCFEIGLSNEPPKSVTIENVHIKGTLKNNAISIFGTVDDAVINISNVIINNCSNPIRISNKTNASGVVLNLINCEFTQWDAGQYAGAIICQDYTSSSSAAAQENNLFAPTKLTINFINCTHNGEKITFTDPAEICTTGDENQVIYVYTDREGIIPYNVDRYPTITCK